MQKIRNAKLGGKENIENRPFKSMHKPESGLFSLASDIALVTTLLNLEEDDVRLLWKSCADEIWHALASLLQEATLVLPPRNVVHPLKSLLEEEIQGLAAAICRLDAAVVAIWTNRNLAGENRNLHEVRATLLIQKVMSERSHKAKCQRAQS